jgi:hypothetical protein
MLLEVKASNIISGDKLPDLIKSGITDCMVLISIITSVLVVI